MSIPILLQNTTSRIRVLGLLSPIHTKNDNYKDNDISVHTSGRYRLFILSARSSAALNSQACDSRIDSDRLSMFFIVHQLKKKKSLSLYHYSCAVDSAIP